MADFRIVFLVLFWYFFQKLSGHTVCERSYRRVEIIAGRHSRLTPEQSPAKKNSMNHSAKKVKRTVEPRQGKEGSNLKGIIQDTEINNPSRS
jgi:hypothetical protein